MQTKSGEILDELKGVLSGRTLDALLPPLVFAGANALWGLQMAALCAAGLAVLLFGLRLARKQQWRYALFGLGAVAAAAGLALLTRRAANYYLPAIISGALLTALALLSLLIAKPLAAWASHLTRGWPLEWFWSAQVKPAYTEVTWFWLLFFTLRLALQVLLYLRGDASTLGWVNALLGWPVTLIVLVASYLYGIWRLRRLGGPGVDEFVAGKQAPYIGQTRGF